MDLNMKNSSIPLTMIKAEYGNYNSVEVDEESQPPVLDLSRKRPISPSSYNSYDYQEKRMMDDSQTRLGSTSPKSHCGSESSETSNGVDHLISTSINNNNNNNNKFKPTRPFKAYPKDPLSLAFRYTSPETLLGNDFSSESYDEFRSKLLSQVQNNNNGTNKNMRRNSQSSQNANNSDPAYWEKRRKNNEAAKRSRDARRAKEDEIAIRCAFLEKENLTLKFKIATLECERERLQRLVYH